MSVQTYDNIMDYKQTVMLDNDQSTDDSDNEFLELDLGNYIMCFTFLRHLFEKNIPFTS